MKTKEQIVNSKPVYLHDWKESKRFGLIMDFEDVYISEAEYKAKKAPYPNVEAWHGHKRDADKALAVHEGEKILFATYTYRNYSGDAWVLFEKGGELYEVNGGHCSCNGLEGQWTPEKVLLRELKHRVTEGRFGTDDYNDGSFKDELKKFLGIKD